MSICNVRGFDCSDEPTENYHHLQSSRIFSVFIYIILVELFLVNSLCPHLRCFLSQQAAVKTYSV